MNHESENDFLAVKPIVLDNGTCMSKSGMAGEDQPRSVMPTMIGYPKYESVMSDVENYARDCYVGNETTSMRGVLKLNYPMDHGIVQDWTAMEKIWHYSFYTDLKVDPSEHPVLLTETPLNPRTNREKMAEIMFETFNVPALYVAMQAVLSLYGSGRTTGTVIDIGDSATHVVPIYEGFALNHATTRIELGGKDINNYLQKLLRQKGYTLASSAEMEIVRDIKEKLCYISLNPEKEIMLAKKTTGLAKKYMLPDGDIIEIDTERFLATEVFFNPSAIGKEIEPIDEVIVNVVKQSDIDLRRDLYSNIVLCGGSTMFPGIKERLTKEIKEQLAENIDVKIIAPPERMFSVWIGGSILSSLKTFHRMWITRREYKQFGCGVVHRCF